MSDDFYDLVPPSEIEQMLDEMAARAAAASSAAAAKPARPADDDRRSWS